MIKTIRLNEETVREIQREADRSGRTWSDVVRERIAPPRPPERPPFDVDEALRRNREDAGR